MTSPALEISSVLILHAGGADEWPFWVVVALIAAGVVGWRIFGSKEASSAESESDPQLILGFECAVYDLLKDRGYAASTARTGDFLVASDGGKSILVGMEYQRTPVGPGSLRRALAAATAQQCDGVLVVTNTGFSRTAKSFARTRHIDLVDGRSLLSFLERRQPSAPTRVDRIMPAG